MIANRAITLVGFLDRPTTVASVPICDWQPRSMVYSGTLPSRMNKTIPKRSLLTFAVSLRPSPWHTSSRGQVRYEKLEKRCSCTARQTSTPWREHAFYSGRCWLGGILAWSTFISPGFRVRKTRQTRALFLERGWRAWFFFSPQSFSARPLIHQSAR